MDLRSLPDGLSAEERCDERRARIERELGINLSILKVAEDRIGQADEKNCEQMFGAVPVPVGYAGPLTVHFSSEERREIHLPLATTEGALVASVNRGCKALSLVNGVHTTSIRRGTSRSIAFRVDQLNRPLTQVLQSRQSEWRKAAERTSEHLKIIGIDIDHEKEYMFLTLFCDTDEAMGMNMATIAAQAAGEWIQENIPGCTLVTVAGNVDSDKKPSTRVHERGRGFEVTAEAEIPSSVLADVLKTTPDRILAVSDAKLRVGSSIAGAIGSNLHAANVVAALFLATGQDAAHVVEGSLADTVVKASPRGIHIGVRLPALMVGVRGGGTGLPAQLHCLQMLLREETKLHICAQLAESIGAAVLAGELSLLAAQASQDLARAHETLAR